MPSTSTLVRHKLDTRGDGEHAALLDEISSHVHDYDGMRLDTMIHPTGPVASTLLAHAEYKGECSGPDVLLAL